MGMRSPATRNRWLILAITEHVLGAAPVHGRCFLFGLTGSSSGVDEHRAGSGGLCVTSTWTGLPLTRRFGAKSTVAGGASFYAVCRDRYG